MHGSEYRYLETAVVAQQDDICATIRRDVIEHGVWPRNDQLVNIREALRCSPCCTSICHNNPKPEFAGEERERLSDVTGTEDQHDRRRRDRIYEDPTVSIDQRPALFAVHEVVSIRPDVFVEPWRLAASNETVGPVKDDHRARVGSLDDTDHCAESLIVLETAYRIDEFRHHGAM